MMLEKYISDLLYRYECVIVPNFGGFVTRKEPSKIEVDTHTFYPPSKQITFNSQLKNNDGLLANYVASVTKTSYFESIKLIEKEVALWNKKLENQEIELKNIGSFVKKENAITFEPFQKGTNYLTSSYGLTSFTARPLQKEIKPVFESSEKRKRIPSFIKYAATAAILLALGTVAFDSYQKDKRQQMLAKAKQQQERVEKSIQEATFVIKNPLPAITLEVTKKTQRYHIVAGAFRNPENALKKVNQLNKKGYNARLLGKNKWGLTQVCYASFDSKRKAINHLYSIQRKVASDAWLLIDDL